MEKGRLKKTSSLQVGDMVIYPYLWSRHNAQGLFMAEKTRPCVIVMREEAANGTFAALLAITSKPVRDFSERMIIPYLERGGVGMDAGIPQSVSMVELNMERLDNDSLLGDKTRAWTFSPKFVRALRSDFEKKLNAGEVSIVPRLGHAELRRQHRISSVNEGVAASKHISSLEL